MFWLAFHRKHVKFLTNPDVFNVFSSVIFFLGAFISIVGEKDRKEVVLIEKAIYYHFCTAVLFLLHPYGAQTRRAAGSCEASDVVKPSMGTDWPQREGK